MMVISSIQDYFDWCENVAKIQLPKGDLTKIQEKLEHKEVIIDKRTKSEIIEDRRKRLAPFQMKLTK